MYFRMLKKDLKDKIALNIVLCIFMMIAATLIVTSAGFVYTFISGIDDTYKKCNTSDIIFLFDRSFSDSEHQMELIEETLRKYSEVGEISVSERIYTGTSRLQFEGIDRRSVTNLYTGNFMISPVSRGQNIPYDQNNELFTLESGLVAIPEIMANNSGAHLGDKITVTTDLGNIYEFTIARIFKDPSSSMINKILFADSDLEILMNEFTCTVNLYEITLTKPFSSVSELQKWGWGLNDELHRLSTDGLISGEVHAVTTGKSNTYTDEAMIALIVSIFMGLMGLALILLIFMSISFTLQATVKREEKEIGTMKAIGVDSLSYKTLFIVKYIAFAVLGGIVGLVAGVPLQAKLVSKFVINTLSPDRNVIIILGVIGSIVFILLMILFSFISLRRINKISVMDTIHGENRGERFSRIPGLSINKLSGISVPSYLAVQDIIRKLKRYLFLIVSYAIGMLIIFLIFQLKRTIISDDYRRTYWGIADREVMIRPEDEIRDKLISQTGSYRNLYLYYEKYYNDNGIPLNIQLADFQSTFLINGTEKYGVNILFGDYDIERLKIVEGGHIPELPNEVIVSHFAQDTHGIDLGDVITLEYKVYAENGFDIETVQRDFIVTAYVESFGNAQSPLIYTIMNDKNIVIDDFDIFNEGIDCPDNEYDAYIEKMRSVNDQIMIWDYDQVMDYELGNSFGRLLDLLAIVTGFIMVITLFSMSFLYQQIFIEEETCDIAMLKSLGFDGRDIRKWHFVRFVLLIVIAAVIAIFLSFTLNKIVFDMLGSLVLNVVSFKIASPPAFSVVMLPTILLVMITAVMAASFKAMDRIKIWRIRNE